MPSLLEALEEKYFTPCHFENTIDDNQNTRGSAATAIIAANERIFSIFIPRLPPLLSVPELLVLNDCDIDCAGDFETIKEKCKRVRELDLAKNKLQDWQEVFQIVQHMPRIEFLNLSKNHLVNPIEKLCSPTIINLRGLVLNGTYLDWSCINVLLNKLPVLEELHLSLNNYKVVLLDVSLDNDEIGKDEDNVRQENCGNFEVNDENSARLGKTTNLEGYGNSTQNCHKVSQHKALKTLHFTGNPVESWNEICRLGRIFPGLENLVLAECPIKAIELNGNAEPTVTRSQEKYVKSEKKNLSDKTEVNSDVELPHQYFENLKFLNLSYANLNKWNDIDQLAKFPKLKNLKVKNWPLWDRLESTEHERRQLLIARLPNVTLLNGGGIISADEREDSERAFIRHYMGKPEWDLPKRYAELIDKHGHLDPLINVNLKPDKHVKVLITFNETTESRLVDIYCTVADLKIRLGKIVGVPPNKIRLYYLDQDYKEFGPEEMRFPNKLLYSYNIQAGDEIIVDQKK